MVIPFELPRHSHPTRPNQAEMSFHAVWVHAHVKVNHNRAIQTEKIAGHRPDVDHHGVGGGEFKLQRLRGCQAGARDRRQVRVELKGVGCATEHASFGREHIGAGVQPFAFSRHLREKAEAGSRVRRLAQSDHRLIECDKHHTLRVDILRPVCRQGLHHTQKICHLEI